MNASPIKLRNGDWGARVDGRPAPGNTLTIRAKSGKTWESVVESVVWTGDGVSIVSLRRRDDYVPAQRNSRGYVTDRGHHRGYCGYPCPVTGKICNPKNGPCHDCE